MIHKYFHGSYHKALGLLLLRLGSGYIFLTHGWMKLTHLGMTAGFFGSLGLPAGTATFIALIEVVGGIMLILGLAPRVAGLVLGIEMVVAVLLVGLPHGSYDLELMLALMCFAIFLVGGGKYSAMSMEHKD